MGAVRRSHVGALLALAALLLLLARLAPDPTAPAPAPRPYLRTRPRPYVAGDVHALAPAADAAPDTQVQQQSQSSPPNRTTTASSTTRRPAPADKTKQAAVPPVPAAPPAPAAPAPLAPGGARPVMTSEVYVAGHERPHPELCPALGARLKMLILVTSAPSHRMARDGVRLTWGHYASRADVALAFVLGAPPAALRPAIEQEDALYGDLVVGRSVDSYSNMTLKTLSMLEWADTYCPRAPRLLKTDDDMFINVPRLLQFAAAPNRVNATLTIWGKVIKKSLPKRTTRSKYYVSPVQYPGKVFPDFATGPAYLVSGDAVRPLLAAAGAEPYLRLEDVFVTGVLASRLGVRRVHAAEFYNKKVGAHPCAVQRGVSIHMVRYHEQFDLWRKLLDGRTKCAS